MLLLLPLLLITPSTLASECVPRTFQGDSFVCVCNSDYCDLPGVIKVPAAGSHTLITTSRDEHRFSIQNGSNDALPGEGSSVVVTLNHQERFQAMMGFGGAFTDATGINILKLTEESQEWLMKSYFSPEGIEYNLCRVPMAGSDFSTRPYSYDDVEGDVDLVHFNLTTEDYKYKLPFIHRAQELAERELLLFGSPWSPPAWMKENGMFNGSGGLLNEMWQPYADYFVKFVQAYSAEGAPIWGLTTQNEPLTGFQDWRWNTCAWTAEGQRDWIKTTLGPTLQAAGMRHLQLMVLDHNRDALPWYPATILEDPESNQFVDGVAIHWYDDDNTGPEVMSELHSLFEDKFLLYTESCDGWDAAPGERVILGDWYRAESYAANIIDDVNHWSTGWVDWNMALDIDGGPNWAYNFVDSPIIIDEKSSEFYKQPMFYSMGHFSKFIAPGDRLISSTVSSGYEHVRVAAFQHGSTDTASTIVLLNMGEDMETVTVDVRGSQEFVNFVMPAKSIVSVLVNMAATAH
ncbi:putative glucosylceramidase 3 [Scylla paramamosain]|uniref:putative glucosylceramidase 3 n=1 Tax=Scylla paramamosain TaxID=85552 RepID=UPI0030835700